VFRYGPNPVCASGGFGAGKTTVLCHKALWLSDAFPLNRGSSSAASQLRQTTVATFSKICPPDFYTHGGPQSVAMEQRIQTVGSTNRNNLSDYLKRYHYQSELTRHLDGLPDGPFTQETVNEIVLWKVNRYVRLQQDVLESLYGLRTLSPNEHRRRNRYC
jgi:hypothetical protein